ncbi:MAG: hypothetical protein A2167_00195 [Planctomycetes bacterium RBG_13_46_10]|nr:MAG: hypothetical protein A2167_00195 [Planctomycetes bacterium RBG_13_46_10]
MLSFLREHSDEQIPALNQTEQQLRAKGADSGASAEAQDKEFLTVSARSKNVRRSTIGFAVLFGVGFVCLLLMIRNSTPKSASATMSKDDDKQIEMAIARLTGANSEMFSRMDQIIKKFYESSNVMQVQVNELVKNPFEFELFDDALNAVGKDELQESRANNDMLKQQQARQAVRGLQLKSIIEMPAGRRNCCMIDDKVLYEGDLIKGFKVTRISDNYVKLKSWDAESSAGESENSGGLEVILRLN